MIVFTICSRNFLGYSEALWTSLKTYHPEAMFYAVLCDQDEGIDRFAFPYPIITIDDLDIKDVRGMSEKYNITEFNTSLKPFAFLYLFDQHPGAHVVYLDPDIMITSRMSELESLFDNNYDCVLTPHITTSAEYGDINENDFVKYGIYNLGFCAFRETVDTRRVVAWWGRRLENDCVIDFTRGLFVDQKWADYFPAFIERTAILRHPGYNAAYWNLSQRSLSQGKDGWLINYEPLRFFHFSGNKIEDKDVFSRHSGQFNIDNTPVLKILLDQYRNLIFRGGHKYYSGFQYAFSWNGSAEFNEHTPETYRRSVQADEAPHLPLLRSYNSATFERDSAHNLRTLKARAGIEARIDRDKFSTTYTGFCIYCKCHRNFGFKILESTQSIEPNYLDSVQKVGLRCLTCGSTGRDRACLTILNQEVEAENEHSVYVTEQATLLFEDLKKRWPTIIGSEFISPHFEGGHVQNGIRHENLEKLSFNDRSFSIILSYDNEQMLHNPLACLSEIFRCLIPGGVLHLTGLFSVGHAVLDYKFTLVSGQEVNQLEKVRTWNEDSIDSIEEYTSISNSEWRLLETMRAIGFCDVHLISYWSELLRHQESNQFLISARRPLSDCR